MLERLATPARRLNTAIRAFRPPLKFPVLVWEWRTAAGVSLPRYHKAIRPLSSPKQACERSIYEYIFLLWDAGPHSLANARAYDRSQFISSALSSTDSS